MVNLKISEIIPPEREELALMKMKSIWSEDAVFFPEAVLKAKDGRRVPVEISASSVEYSGSRVPSQRQGY